MLYLTISPVHAMEDIWIDTDPACGHDKTDDVDDCWALLTAINAKELNISGISTVFGNESGQKTYRTAQQIVHRFGPKALSQRIFRGADGKLDAKKHPANNSTHALAAALTKKRHTILALGPLTNIANLLLNHPERAADIKQIIAVAGQRPSDKLGFYPGQSKLFHLHDMNFRKDVAAFEVILNSSIPLILIPYEIAIKISINDRDLRVLSQGNEISKWLAKISQPWLGFWQTSLHTEGFSPFDSLAVGYLLYRELYTCEEIPITIQKKRALFVTSRDKLILSRELESTRHSTYCYDIDPRAKERIVDYSHSYK